MNEFEAVQKSLKLCGFNNMGEHWVHERYDLAVYIPAAQAMIFDTAIDFMNTFAFFRVPNKEERLIYYRTGERLKRYRKLWESQGSL